MKAPQKKWARLVSHPRRLLGAGITVAGAGLLLHAGLAQLALLPVAAAAAAALVLTMLLALAAALTVARSLPVPVPVLIAVPAPHPWR